MRRLHVALLMKRMGIEAIYRRPTRPNLPGAYDLPVSPAQAAGDAAQQVWAMDITYIPMARGSSILRPSSTGSAGRFWHGSYRLRR